ncbi:MAG TPA: aldehyde dehydrogenase EutE [bacterium]|nr:aldehyde dehydrogenase EutE [bacterium]HPO07766.1 aldehyde dehydrogenase EutE [bacterium]HQO33572.1 aldehyde dehydrogenase EutE [bacterium]HQP99893.1 aldehyde dehydrogenase EutE [bacterium]
MDEARITEIVRQVLAEFQAGGGTVAKAAAAPAASPSVATVVPSGGNDGIFGDIEDAINASVAAQAQLAAMGMDMRKKIVSAIRQTALAESRRLAELAVADTGMGRADHKQAKNDLATEKTPGTEDLVPDCFTGDHGMTFVDYAPFGVIGSITPCTNPTSTIINHGIAMIAAGNSVVFGPHPAAIQSTLEAIRTLNRAIIRAGGPPNLLTSIAEPTLRTAKILMTHPKVNLLVATGGASVVKAAMTSGKRAIAAGPGNPPVVVDETADLPKAARDIIAGASFDNNMPCICEKECFVVQTVADQLILEMQHAGAYLINRQHVDSLTKILINEEGHPNREYVGKSPQVLLSAIGLSAPSNTDLVICETAEEHPFVQEELLMPILAIVRVPDYNAAVEAAVRAEHGFRHTAIIHTARIDRITDFAKRIRVNLFVANGPCGAVLGSGGEGYMAMTIAGPTGEGACTPRIFSIRRRVALPGSLRVL